MMPACAALPAWNGFVIVPKFAIRPALCEAPSAIAVAVLCGIQLAQLRARRGGADRAIKARRMPALLVAAAVAPHQLGPGLIARDIGDDHVGPQEPSVSASARIAGTSTVDGWPRNATSS